MWTYVIGLGVVIWYVLEVVYGPLGLFGFEGAMLLSLGLGTALSAGHCFRRGRECLKRELGAASLSPKSGVFRRVGTMRLLIGASIAGTGLILLALAFIA